MPNRLFDTQTHHGRMNKGNRPVCKPICQPKGSFR